jgi:chromosome segregation protein
MSGGPFRIREVALAGFGPYRRATRFQFPEGPGVLLGPNESGKTTLLLGLAATFFGLPATNDATGFTTARFRSRPAAREFWGEVAWESDGRRYRLHRAFDSHRVRWLEETDRGPQVRFEGEHNPLAKSQSRNAYPQLLRESLGIGSYELFIEAFCLGQVAPESGDLSADLQHLLSGSRTGRTDDVLQRLFDEVKDRTRATGDLGLLKPGNERAVNQRDPGRLERIEEDVARARKEMETGRSGLERVNELGVERETIEADRKELAASLERRRQRVATLKRWTALEEERRRREEEMLRARGQLRELDEVEAKRKAEEALADPAQAALLQSPADLGARLDALAVAEEAIAARQSDEAGQEAERARLTAEIQALQGRLDGELAPLRGMDDPVRLHRELVEAIRIRARRDGDMELASERTTALESRLATEIAWPDDLDPILLRARAETFLRDTRRLSAIAARQSEIAGPLEGRRFLDDSRMEALRRKLAIQERLRTIGARNRELEMEAARQAEAIARAEAEAAQARAAEALQRADSADSRAREAASGRSNPISPWLSILGAGAVSAGLHFGLDLGWPISLGVGAGIFVLLQVANLLLRRARSRRLPSRSAAAAAGRATATGRPTAPDQLPAAGQVAAPSPPAAPSPATAESQAAPAAFPRIDPAAELQSLRAERESLEAEILPLREQLGPFADVSGPEIGGMEARWADLAAEQEQLAAESKDLLEGLLGAEFMAGGGSDGVTDASARAGADAGGGKEDWASAPAVHLPEGMRELFRLPGAPQPGSCGELAAWLSELDEPAWTRYRDDAAGRRDIGERLRQERETLANHERERRHDPDVTALQEALQPFTVDTPEEELARLAGERRNAEESLRDCVTHASLIPAAPILLRRREEAEMTLVEAREALRRAWPAGPEPPSTGLREWAEHVRESVAAAREAATRSKGREEAAAGILRAASAIDRAEVERREANASAALGATNLEIGRLESEDPFLASSREIRDPLERAARLRQAHEAEERDLADEAGRDEALHRRDLELAAELGARPEGTDLNLARRELELGRMAEELERLRFERDALALAYGWVREAADLFRGTYREDLELRIGNHFATLTGRAGRRVKVDDRFRLVPVEPDGSEFSPAQLSQGARDQLQLAVRLALADLLAGSVPLPLFFDDPFVHFDPERLELLHGALERLSASRQWVLLTHRADLASWGAPVQPVYDRGLPGAAAAVQ